MYYTHFIYKKQTRNKIIRLEKAMTKNQVMKLTNYDK